jgi:hypothetical protein
MSWKITLSDGSSDRPLPEDITLVGGLRLGNQLIVTNEGIAKFRPSETPDPVMLTLQQPLGHDKSLLDLFGKKAGFKLKLTLSLPKDDGNGGIVQKDILDVNVKDLVPDDFHISEVLTLTAQTMTMPEVILIGEAPRRTPRRAG